MAQTRFMIFVRFAIFVVSINPIVVVNCMHILPFQIHLHRFPVHFFLEVNFGLRSTV